MTPMSRDGIVRSLRNKLLAFFRRYQLSDQTFLIIVAVIVGFLGGLGSIFFEMLIELGQHFFFDIFPDLLGDPEWLVILIPAFGAFFLAPLIYFFPVEAKSDGVPATMEAVALKRGIIKVRTFSTRMLASAITLGSGGSAGKEGRRPGPVQNRRVCRHPRPRLPADPGRDQHCGRRAARA